MQAEHLLSLATQSGAAVAEVYQASARSQPAFFEANRLKQLESSESLGTALRLWCQGRPGLAVAYGDFEPAQLVEKAVALAQLNASEPIELAAAARATFPTLGATVPVEVLVEQGRSAIANLRDQYPEILCSAELECETATTLLLNSRGLHCTTADISLSAWLGAEWVRGENFLGIYEDEEARDRLAVPDLAAAIAQRLDWAKTNVSAPTGRIPVIFTRKAAGLLWSAIEAATNGKRLVEQASPWSDSLGQRLLDPALTLRQVPDFGPYSCPIDDEGTPTQAFDLIRAGEFVQPYCDRVTGRQLQQASTGNGFRPSLDRYPTPSLINLCVEPGTGDLYSLIGSLDRALLVDQVLGGGPDLSGDFSVNVDLGYCIERGAVVGRVKDTMLAGNVYTALADEVVLAGDRAWQGSYYTPAVLVNGLSVTTQS
ncbi:MAG: TldD/PmbA family protein [Spirulinaceae cyanobacterium SM2_1_0]|nr:TldD/PmbA family protein [Spirulinaceae cyanobacterium SM2_1_0]